ncbi:MAG: heterodisulfide reductase-related iron-sulfur binding cluster [Bacteroidetes bacterium]|nr:heterodisulfide reductase-related iron-sulfur binding cluster [Bacteroidota bacterium]
MKIEGKKQIWNDYQKEIAEDHFFYVRSCIRQNFFPGSEKSFLRIMKEELKKDVYENPSHTTCSGIGYHTDIVPFETSMTMVARQFALMTEAGYENFTTSCITSFGLYSEVLNTWEHEPEMEEKAREFLYKATGREFKKPKNVSHASDVIYRFRKEIAEKGKYRLVNKLTGEPIRVVEHIGCHYSKMFPSKGVGGAEYPYVLIGMIEDWGGEVIDYPERRHCCGFGFRQYLVQANRGFSVSCSKKKFDSMEPYQPEMILTNCPGCPMFLDRWQYAISEMEGKTYGPDGTGIPVLTYEELAGLVLGHDPWDLGLQVHQVPVEPLLDKIGISYDPEKKFKAADGSDIGRPEAPVYLKFYPEQA